MAPNEDKTVDPRTTRLADGRVVSTEELTPLVYDDLRRLAASFFRHERVGITLQPTALVHEAWLRLADQRSQDWDGRSHFLAVAATAMRRVLINAARARGRDKRGGDWERVTLNELDSGSSANSQLDLLVLDEALEALTTVNPLYSRIIELRCFAGLNLDEVAEVMDLGRTTVVKHWAMAKAWLAAWLDEQR